MSELAGKPFTKHVRLYHPRKRSGHEGVHDAVQAPRNNHRAVLEQTAEALRYALLDAHRFQRHGLRIEAERGGTSARKGCADRPHVGKHPLWSCKAYTNAGREEFTNTGGVVRWAH